MQGHIEGAKEVGNARNRTLQGFHPQARGCAALPRVDVRQRPSNPEGVPSNVKDLIRWCAFRLGDLMQPLQGWFLRVTFETQGTLREPWALGWGPCRARKAAALSMPPDSMIIALDNTWEVQSAPRGVFFPMNCHQLRRPRKIKRVSRWLVSVGRRPVWSSAFTRSGEMWATRTIAM